MKRERAKGRKKKKEKQQAGDLYFVQPLLSRLLLSCLLLFFSYQSFGARSEEGPKCMLVLAEKKTVRTGMRFLRLKEPE